MNCSTFRWEKFTANRPPPFWKLKEGGGKREILNQPPIPCGKEKLGNVKSTYYVICTGFFLKRDEDERGKERERERERQRERER